MGERHPGVLESALDMIGGNKGCSAPVSETRKRSSGNKDSGDMPVAPPAKGHECTRVSPYHTSIKPIDTAHAIQFAATFVDHGPLGSQDLRSDVCA